MQLMLSVHDVVSREKEDDLERRFKLLNHELRNCLSIEGRHRHTLHSLHCCWMMKVIYSDKGTTTAEKLRGPRFGSQHQRSG